MNAKETKIKEAYGEYWKTVKDYVDSNGWVVVGTYHNNEPIDFEIFEIDLDSNFEERSFGRHKETLEYVRPKSLQGIEDNNGWHAVSEEDFPEDELTVFWFNNDNGEFETASLLHCDFNHKDYTHWHILPPKPPIY